MRHRDDQHRHPPPLPAAQLATGADQHKFRAPGHRISYRTAERAVPWCADHGRWLRSAQWPGGSVAGRALHGDRARPPPDTAVRQAARDDSLGAYAPACATCWCARAPTRHGGRTLVGRRRGDAVLVRVPPSRAAGAGLERGPRPRGPPDAPGRDRLPRLGGRAPTDRARSAARVGVRLWPLGDGVQPAPTSRDGAGLWALADAGAGRRSSTACGPVLDIGGQRVRPRTAVTWRHCSPR